MRYERFEIYDRHGELIGYVDLDPDVATSRVYAVRSDRVVEVGLVWPGGVYRGAGLSPFERDRTKKVGMISIFDIFTGTDWMKDVVEVGHVIPETGQILKGGTRVPEPTSSAYEHPYDYVGAMVVGYAVREGRAAVLTNNLGIEAVGGAALLLGLV